VQHFFLHALQTDSLGGAGGEGKTMTDHLQKAITYAHKRCGDHKRERKWLRSSTEIPASYNDENHYPVRVQVLEGSPPRAILVTTLNWTSLQFWDGSRKIFKCKWEECR